MRLVIARVQECLIWLAGIILYGCPGDARQHQRFFLAICLPGVLMREPGILMRRRCEVWGLNTTPLTNTPSVLQSLPSRPHLLASFHAGGQDFQIAGRYHKYSYLVHSNLTHMCCQGGTHDHWELCCCSACSACLAPGLPIPQARFSATHKCFAFPTSTHPYVIRRFPRFESFWSPRGCMNTGAPPEVALLRAPRLSVLPQFQGEHRERTLWGTYRPGLYFGATSFPGMQAPAAHAARAQALQQLLPSGLHLLLLTRPAGGTAHALATYA